MPTGDSAQASFVNVIVTETAIPGAVVVSSQAMQTGQRGSYVFRIKADGTVEVAPVSVVLTHEVETVIKDGLSPSELVVATGQLHLVAGSRISVTGEEPTEP